MYIYVYICIYMYIYVYICIYMYIYVYICIYMYIYIYIHMCVCSMALVNWIQWGYLQIYINLFFKIDTYVHKHTCIYIYNGYFYWKNCGEITDGKLGEMTDGDCLRDRDVMRYCIKKIWFENDLLNCLKTAMVPTTENTYFIGLFGNT